MGKTHVVVGGRDGDAALIGVSNGTPFWTTCHGDPEIMTFSRGDAERMAELIRRMGYQALTAPVEHVT